MKQRIFDKTEAAPSPDPVCGPNADRRRVFSIMATGLVTPMTLTAGSAHAQPAAQLLVDAGAEADFKPLRPDDIQMMKPILAFPFDAETGTPKKESRLSKMVVIRLPEEKMTPETRARSVAGVVAYSSICTHQGCDVKTWMSKENVLACYCHASKFDLFDGAKVVAGPASSALRAIPLALNGEFLSIAAPLPPKAGE
jgi:rieske iron-sulfur protein